MHVKLPMGKSSIDGRMLTVEAVERGLACECVCPECGSPLVARKGDVLRHHFGHSSDAEACVHAGETALHLFAKQIIRELQEISYPKWHVGFRNQSFPVELGRILNVREEVTLDGGIRADLLVQFEREPVAVEIWVAHAVDADKITKLDEHKIACFEIDLTMHRFAEKGEQEWQEAVLHKAHRYWLYPPACVRNAEDKLRQEWLDEQRRKQDEAIAIQQQREQERLQNQRILEEFEARISEEMRRRGEQRRQHEELQIQLAQAKQEEREAINKALEERERVKRASDRIRYADLSRAIRERREREQASPDLQALVRVHGGFHRIPPEAWEDYDRALAAWKGRLHTKHFQDQSTIDPVSIFRFTSQEWSTDFCEVCDQPARFGYQDEGKMVWFCADHRLAQWWSDARQ